MKSNRHNVFTHVSVCVGAYLMWCDGVNWPAAAIPEWANCDPLNGFEMNDSANGWGRQFSIPLRLLFHSHRICEMNCVIDPNSSSP